MRIYLSPPDVGEVERAFMNEAFDGGWIAPAGPDLAAFESDVAALTGWPGAVALSSGTAALHLALLSVGVQPGDDVLVSSFTFSASANAVRYCGAEPVFIDSESSSWNMSPALLADELAECRRRNRLPAAVMVVDLYGQCADFDPIMAACRELGIPVVEDSAEALGATYHGRPAGALADVGVFSFNGNKIITTSGGGMLVTPSVEVAERVRYLSTQARQPAPHYEHTEVGYNYRLSNLLAALGRGQFSRLPELVERRRQINSLYRELLADVCSFMPVPGWSGWNGWLTCVQFADGSQPTIVREALLAEGIESRPLWKPMHQQPAFAGCRNRVDGTSGSVFGRGLCLPSGSALSDGEVAEVAALVRRPRVR
ncbi:MAG: aminotransferase class I/II-fold pyridoxal phosphate-dependent enzyme [Actinomycetota bacterium]